MVAVAAEVAAAATTERSVDRTLAKAGVVDVVAGVK